jgi:type II secretory pathway component PulM
MRDNYKTMAVKWFAGLSQREQNALSLLAAIVIPLLLWKAVWQPVEAARERQQALFVQTRADLAWMKGSTMPSLGTQEALAYVKASAEARNIVFSEEPKIENDSISLTLEQANFDELAAWLYQMEAEKGTTVLNASLEAASGSIGFVNGSLVVR